MARIHFDQSGGEIWFARCRYDGSLEDGRDPFTLAPVKLPHNAPLTSTEQRAVESVIEQARVAGGAANLVRVADGGTAEISVWPNAVMLRPRMVPPTASLAGLLYELLLAGNWCITADDTFVVANAEHARQRPRKDPRVPAGFYESIPKDVTVVESAIHLASALGWTDETRRA